MKNLESVYEAKVPELKWYRKPDCVEVETNGRLYRIIEKSKMEYILIIKENNKQIGKFKIDTCHHAKALAEHIESVYCFTYSIEMVVEY